MFEVRILCSSGDVCIRAVSAHRCRLNETENDTCHVNKASNSGKGNEIV